MTFIKEDQMPKLFSILFGEGVLNDAVCIVLYNILFILILKIVFLAFGQYYL
jgi:NhaP-type Na+/H+ or K+/H+ antiporter